MAGTDAVREQLHPSHRHHMDQRNANQLEEYGHKLLPLPPYSPDLNPIEQTFAIIKRKIQVSGESLKKVLS
jgi:transposase